MTSNRTDLLIASCAELDVDGMIVTGEANRRYLSGFTGSSGTLLISVNARWLVTDSRYTEQAGRQAIDYDVIESVELLQQIKCWVVSLGVSRLGFESEHTSVKQLQELTDFLAAEQCLVTLVPLEDVVEAQRVVKDKAELNLLTEAVRLADDVMHCAGEWLVSGVVERDLAADLEHHMRKLGGDGPSFPTIVASGPNGAMAHHSPGDRLITNGDSVIVDLGVKLDGYCSDITRTFYVGGSDDRFREIYGVVLSAQAAVETGMSAGMTGKTADGLARQVIVDAGFGDCFGHGTGHGVGLEIHEAPTVSPRNEGRLPVGAVTSVEPGIYVPGWGGVRIEDLVVIGDDCVEVLTQSAK
ncbi:MAG: peptidase M24 [Chloroflexi bacterium]|nr:peptidase M24 [Chloroflexota bacterium]HCU72549.1 aminopeptidase P family protein [Chloroflexota bacterium]